MIKGYGSTHHNGWANFVTIMDHLEVIKKNTGAAGSIAELRKAALADENGDKLRAALAR